MTTTQLAPSIFSLGSIDAYYKAVNAAPMLSAEEERALARRYHDENDLEAAWQLVMSHLRFVVRIARSYSGYGLPEADLVQEGNIGLMKAVKRFDPELGVRLVSFAVHWIKAEIHEYVLRNWRIVKVATTKAQRKLFYNLRASRKRLGWMNREETAALAEDLDVSADAVREMEKRLAARDTAFDASPSEEGEDRLAPAGFLSDPASDPATLVEEADWDSRSRECLIAGLDSLDERSRAIVTRRWLEEPRSTLQELATEYGVSAERIRQIEHAAFARLRSNLAEC